VFGSFLDLSGEENFVEDGIDFVKVKHQVELADVAKERVCTCTETGREQTSARSFASKWRKGAFYTPSTSTKRCIASR
jgi:hypothetical protein